MPDTKKSYNPLNDTKLIDDINNAFIKKFKTDEYHYIYDVNTNEIVKVDEIIWNLFPDTEESYKADLSQLIEKHGKDELQRALHEINSSMEKEHLFSSNRPKICMTITQEELEKHIKHKNEQTILNVTEDCNFRCKYCVYSGIYENVRTHSKKYMTWETAKAAMDDFIINSAEVEDPAFSFYGGEPMLAMDLIQKCVDYLKKKNKKCHFSITTNGSLLNPNNINYLIENNFSIALSLNGPKKNHDAYRVDINGKGTWDKIIRNIEYFIKYNEEYFSKKIIFNCTFTPPYQIKDSLDFFHTKFPSKNVLFNRVDYSDTRYFIDKFSEKILYDDYNKQKELLFKYYLDAVVNEKEFSKYSWLLSRVFECYPSDIHQRPMYELNSEIYPQGQCIMGTRRIFVDSNGDYFPCERVKDQFKIGDVCRGLNLKEIFVLMNEFQQLHVKRCFGCPCIRLCLKCILEIGRNGRYEESKLENICNYNKNKVIDEMLLYCSIVEKNKDSMNKIERILVK